MPENSPTAEEKRARKNIFFLGLVSFFNDFASDMIYPLLPLFLTMVLKAGAASIGVIEGVAETTASLLKFFSGYWSDKYRRRKPIFASGYALSNTVRPLMGVAGSWWHVLLLRFSDRIGKGIRTAPRDALMADSAGTSKAGPRLRLSAGHGQRRGDHGPAGRRAAAAAIAQRPQDALFTLGDSRGCWR